MGKDIKNNYLFADDEPKQCEPITEEILKSMLPPIGKVSCGMLAGIFNIKDFEKVSGRLDKLENVRLL